MDGQPLFKVGLVIEDDSAHGLLIKRSLSSLVESVILVSNLKEGQQHLTDNRYDLIITDLNLPDAKGVTHIENLVKFSEGSPVLVLTSSTSIQDAVQAMSLGASDYIVKSFDQNFHENIRLTLERVKSSQILKEEKRKLEREMMALRTAIENGQDAMAVFALSGEIKYKNSSFDRFVDTCGGGSKSISQILTAKIKDSDKINQSLNKQIANLGIGAVWSTELVAVSDPDIAFDLSLSTLERVDQKSGTMVLWARDISERKRRERFQKEILSTTTHDLRGPLGSISLCGEMLLDLVKTPDKAVELSKRVLAASKGALNMIDEFLHARRLQEGLLILEPARRDVVELAEAVIAEQKILAEARGVALSFNSQGERVGVVDGLSFARVVQNLVSNAIKFSEKGGAVQVGLDVKSSVVTLTVTDNGAGMEPGDVQRLFERFSRLSKHSQIEGSGLGLYLVKNIVSAHGGSINVTSQPGKGSTFIIELPANPPVNDRGQIMCLDFA
jgi:signal transduction histidine kinase/CheY-like chemotaxis protein